MWYRGYLHVHTQFHHPKTRRISPSQLADHLKRWGASFAFCAGDHGDLRGRYYFGLDTKEFREYRKECLSIGGRRGVFLVPAPEIHLMFPPYNERHEHHACLPALARLPQLEPPESKVLAASYTRDIAGFLTQCHQLGISSVLNHPRLSMGAIFGGPKPTDVKELSAFDYYELATKDHPDFFNDDFTMYLALSSQASPSSSMAACCGIDSLDRHLWENPEKNDLPATALFIEGAFSLETLMKAWHQQKCCACIGNIYPEHINPLPGRDIIRSKKVLITITTHAHDDPAGIDIYRNGRPVLKAHYNGSEYEWEDDCPAKGINSYLVHIHDSNSHLVTAPIHFAAS